MKKEKAIEVCRRIKNLCKAIYLTTTWGGVQIKSKNNLKKL